MRDTDLTPDEILALAELLAAYKADMVPFSEVCNHVEDLLATRVTTPGQISTRGLDTSQPRPTTPADRSET